MQSSLTSSKILFYLCISFIVGVFLASIIKILQSFVWGIFVLGILIIFISCLRLFLSSQELWNKILVVGFCVLALVLGILRFQISVFNIANNELAKLNGKGAVILTGIISDEPDSRDASQILKLKVGSNLILITTDKYPEYKYLDKIKITGELKEPSAPDFDYKTYLMVKGVYSVMDFPKIQLVEKGNIYRSPATLLYGSVLLLKEKLRQSIQNNFLPPHSQILEGMLLGDNAAMSQDLKNQLNITGLRHIISVSGTHIVIFGAILMSILLALGFWRGQAFYISIVFIAFYVVLTGMPSSAVRAGIMGGLFLLAQKLGRMSAAPRIIVLAGAVILLFNPFLLFFDTGFQLSFLAVLSLIYLAPQIENFLMLIYKKILYLITDGRRLLNRKEENGFNGILGIVSATLAAQIFTLPVLVYNFGNISFVSPLTNILIAPAVYLLMVFGFVSAIFGAVSGILGKILFAPTFILLSYFLKILEVFSSSWAMIQVKTVPWIFPVIYFVILFAIIWHLNKYKKPNFL